MCLRVTYIRLLGLRNLQMWNMEQVQLQEEVRQMDKTCSHRMQGSGGKLCGIKATWSITDMNLRDRQLWNLVCDLHLISNLSKKGSNVVVHLGAQHDA